MADKECKLVSIDVSKEQVITLKEAARTMPGRPHVSTLHRWANRRANPLETIRIGGRRYTSLEAIERFIQRCSDPVVTAPQTVGKPRDLAAVDDHLRREGLL